MKVKKVIIISDPFKYPWDFFKHISIIKNHICIINASIWSCHIIVRYNLFGLLAYSATISVAEHSVHP